MVKIPSCPECGSSRVVWSEDEGMMCNKCGLIIEEPTFSGTRLLV